MSNDTELQHSEFKFACPSCGQRIQATEAYSGREIPCPACQEPLVVPEAPESLTRRPAISVAPWAPAQPEPAAPLMQRPAFASRRPKTRGVVIGSVAGLVVVGAVGLILFSGVLSRSDGNPAGTADKKAMAHKDLESSASTHSQSLSAAEIVRKVGEQYGNLTSYRALGTAVSVMDMSKVDSKNQPGPGQVAAGGKSSKASQQTTGQPVRSESEFSVKLGRPGFYRVEWESKLGPSAIRGAAWSAGEGDFLSIARTKYTKMEGRELALASATGASGGAAGTLPAIFFKDRSSLLASFKKATRGKDETVDGEECYVLTGGAMGMRVSLWVTKEKFLLKQKQMSFGGKSTMPEVSEAQMEEQFKKMGHMTPEQKALARAAVKNMKPMLSQMSGTMTETYRNIEVNPPVKREDFDYQMPPGASLSKSLF